MKKLVLLLAVIIFGFTESFSQTDYLQFEVMSVTPKADKMDLFKKGMAAHNKKFHAKDPYKVGVSFTVSGPNSGAYTWVMGPTTWAQMDSRPGKGEHDIDWEKNVVPYCESFGEVSYWRVNNDVNYQPEGVTTLPKGRLRFNFVYPDQMDRFEAQMKKIMEVYKKYKYKNSFALVTRYGASSGAKAVTINNYPNWGSMDSAPGSFIKNFEELHGAGSWAKFLAELNLCIDRSQTYDELSEDVPELGGGN